MRVIQWYVTRVSTLLPVSIVNSATTLKVLPLEEQLEAASPAMYPDDDGDFHTYFADDDNQDDEDTSVESAEKKNTKSDLAHSEL
jgi:hypothetical protein